MRSASGHRRWWAHGAGSVVPPGAGRVTVPAGVPARRTSAPVPAWPAPWGPPACEAGRATLSALRTGVARVSAPPRVARAAAMPRRGVRGVRVGTAGVRTTAVVAGGPAPVPAARSRRPRPGTVAEQDDGAEDRDDRDRQDGETDAAPLTRGADRRAVQVEFLVEQPLEAGRPAGLRVAGGGHRDAALLELVETLREPRERARPGALGPLPQAGRRLERPQRRGAHRRQHALAVAARDRRRVAAAVQERPLQERGRPRPDGDVGERGRVGREPGGGHALGQPAEGEREPGGVLGGGPAQHPPALDREAQAGRQHEEPAVAVAAEVEHAAHLAAADAAPAGDGLGEPGLVPLAAGEHDPHLRPAAGVGVERVDRAERMGGKRGRAREVAVGDDVRAGRGSGHVSHATGGWCHRSARDVCQLRNEPRRPDADRGLSPVCAGPARQVSAWKMAVVTSAPSTPP